jgi:steroid delta-isomerase-like uncharacterized protein
MSVTQSNKAVIRKLYDMALNKRRLDLLQDLIAEEYTGPQGQKGAAGFEAPVAPLINAFPDMQWNIETLIAEGDEVVVSWKLTGTHTGQFTYIAPTGKMVTSGGIGIYLLKDGKVTASKIYTDRLGFLQALDVLPQDIGTLYTIKQQ